MIDTQAIIIALKAERDAIRLERDELQRTFDLRWKADMRAIKRWQAAHPNRKHTWPDHADMVVWLMEKLDEANAAVKASTNARTTRSAHE